MGGRAPGEDVLPVGLGLLRAAAVAALDGREHVLGSGQVLQEMDGEAGAPPRGGGYGNCPKNATMAPLAQLGIAWVPSNSHQVTG